MNQRPDTVVQENHRQAISPSCTRKTFIPRQSRNGLLMLVIVVSGSLNTIHAADWPQWRGPTRDCRIDGSFSWPESLADDHLNEVWKVSLGPSYSGPIVVDSRVFVTETRDESHEVVRALDRQSGKELWKVEWPGALSVPFFARSNGSWIRATPACNGESLFVAGIRDVLVCLDVETGAERWRVDFVDKYKAEVPAFGTACSPLCDDGFVYLQAAASVVKVDAATGDVVWRAAKAGEDGMLASAFSSPVIETIGGERQLVVQSRKALIGLDLETGSEIWSVEVPAFRGMNIQTPMVIGDSVFTSTYGGGTFLFDVVTDEGKFTATERWKTAQQGYMSSPVLINNQVYLHLRNQRFTCVDPASGESSWTTAPFGKYWSMVVNGPRILALDQRGDLLLIDAQADEFRTLDTRHLTDAETWAHLAVTGDQIFVRELNAVTAYSWK